MNTKINEIDYVSHLSQDEKKWLQTKPFGNYNYHESYLRIRDFSYIVELLELSRKNYSILDLGCGPGWTSIMLAKLGLETTGVDISPAMIKIAKVNAQKEKVKVKFITEDIEKIRYHNHFDRVLLYDALHHCPNEAEVLKNAFKALKNKGMLVIAEPNIMHPKNPNSKKAVKRFGVLEKGYSPRYLTKLLKKIGFKQIIRYHCNYGLTKPMPQGIISFFKQLGRVIVGRLILSHFQSQVWILAKK